MHTIVGLPDLKHGSKKPSAFLEAEGSHRGAERSQKGMRDNLGFASQSSGSNSFVDLELVEHQEHFEVVALIEKATGSLIPQHLEQKGGGAGGREDRDGRDGIGGDGIGGDGRDRKDGKDETGQSGGTREMGEMEGGQT